MSFDHGVRPRGSTTIRPAWEPEPAPVRLEGRGRHQADRQADRASLLARLVLDAEGAFAIDCTEMHNDSTSVRLTGAYPLAKGHALGGKPTAVTARGHSKDFRPDLEQLVWILTVSADGAVPIVCRVASGNVEDSTTHLATSDGLCALLGRSDCRYVADSNLAIEANMEHIDRHGGRFVTVLPASRREDGAFRRYLVDHEPTWTEVRRCPARRLGEPDDVYETTEAPWPSAEGFQVIWVRSSHKVERDADSRSNRVAAGIAALDELNQKLPPELPKLQRIVLDLLGVPEDRYR